MKSRKQRKKPAKKKGRNNRKHTRAHAHKTTKKRAKPGQPTKYKRAYCAAIIKYFDIEFTREVEIEHSKGHGENQETWTETRLEAASLRYLANFAHSIGTNPQRLLEWCKVHPEFKEAYERAKELQKQHLIECGTRGLFNSHFTIFTAKNMTDMRDKTEHEIGGKDGAPIPVTSLLEVIDGSSKGKLPDRQEAADAG